MPGTSWDLLAEETAWALKMDRHVQVKDTSFCSLGSSPNGCYRVRIFSSVNNATVGLFGLNTNTPRIAILKRKRRGPA